MSHPTPDPKPSTLDDLANSVRRIGGVLHEIVPVVDEAGKIISTSIRPLMIEFKARDAAQIIVGSSLLALPLCFTEEAWDLGAHLPGANVAALGALSLAFIAMFVFFNFYRGHFRGHAMSFVARVAITYALSLALVAVILTLLEKCPWQTEPLLAVKRIVIVAFPASMAGSITDALK